MVQEKITNKGLQVPVRTGTVGDNLSLSFSSTKDIITEYWKYFLVIGLIIAAANMATTAFLLKLPVVESVATEMKKQMASVYGSFISSVIMTGYLRSIGLMIFLPAFLIAIVYRFQKFAVVSEVFEDLPKRGFISWLLWYVLNWFTGTILWYIMLAIYTLIIVLAIVLLFQIDFLALKIFAVILGIAGGIFFFIFIFVYVGLINQIAVFTLFRKVYPIAAVRYSILSSFKTSGSRKGGFWGLNLWHFIGLSLLAYLIVATFSYTTGFLLILVDALLPQSIPGMGIISSAMFGVVNVFTYTISYFFWYMTSAIYVAENMTYGAHPLREEILKRASK
jgi:hypothetical protein